MRGRPRQTTHHEIRRVALDLFVAHGYERTSLVDIARAVGISRTTLFAYFPAKRDLLWEDHDKAMSTLHDALHEHRDLDLVALVMTGIGAVSVYDIDDHAVMSDRWRIVQASDELRAYAALRADQVAATIRRAVADAYPSVAPELADDVTSALLAIASRCTAQWALDDGPQVSLLELMHQRTAPFAPLFRSLVIASSRLQSDAIGKP